MAREPSEESERARERRPDAGAPRVDDPAAGVPEADALRDEAARSESGALSDEELYGRGRSRPLTPEESRALAREQGEAIRSGRASKGQVILNTPLRRAIFIAGLAGLLILALIVSIFR